MAQPHASARCVCLSVQEPRNLLVWQEKFGFKKLNSKALKALQSSVPALNYYEDSTLLAKPLKKGSSSKQQPRSQKGEEASAEGVQPQGSGDAQQSQAAGTSLAVEPLKV